MNIAIDIRNLMENEITGVGEYTFNLLTALFELDKSNNYFLFYNSSKNVTVPPFNFENVKLVKFSFPNKLLNLSLKVLKYPKLDKLIFRKLNVKIDLFFFPNLNFFAADCSYFITCHDLSFEIFPEFFSWKRKLWHKIINPKKLFEKAKKIIAVSSNTKSDLENIYKINPEKIYEIYSGVSEQFQKLDLSDPGRDRVRKKYHLPSKFILYLGTLEPRKNIESLIEAFSLFKQKNQSKNIELVIAGKPGWKYSSIFNSAKKSKHFKQIHFINYVNNKDKVFLYNLAQCFVFPSYYEGFGFPPLEAIYCGTTTIASHTSSLPEILGNNAIYIDPYNINDIVKSFESIDTFSLKVVNRKFSWQTTAEKMLKIFIDTSINCN